MISKEACLRAQPQWRRREADYFNFVQSPSLLVSTLSCHNSISLLSASLILIFSLYVHNSGKKQSIYIYAYLYDKVKLNSRMC